ncbi:4Fe-4S single cluster domain-containing protein [Curtobacterium sp. SP.BCo]|uniref:4Fe-4S single cluster domain-containing protein n=1 Tax=Curtobacterium sp. SP.BCo TaxID=3435229 RepID=UPI003F73B114
MTNLQVGRLLSGTTAEGPGRRTAVWTQGCSIRCVGCINPHLFTKRGGQSVPVSAVVEAAIDSGDEGLTLLGGEPFDQSTAIAELCAIAQDAGLGVIAFSGYTHAELAGRADLSGVDLLVDGPYVRERPEGRRPLVGSENQRFVHLTDRYVGQLPWSNTVEVRVGPDGAINLAGFLRDADLERFSDGIGRRRLGRGRAS